MRSSLRLFCVTLAACWQSALVAAADCNCRQGSAPAWNVTARAWSPAMPVIPVTDPNLPNTLGVPAAPHSGLPVAPIPEIQPPLSTRQQALPPPPTPFTNTAIPPAVGPAPLTQLLESPIAPGEVAAPSTNRFGVAPPPGTLGRTYQRRSSLIDDDKHPRMAAVDVHLPEEANVTARGLKSRWTGSVWRLETETPLLPGVPHIYAIKVERLPGNGDKQPEVRWVRLIPGRIVDLEFE